MNKLSIILKVMSVFLFVIIVIEIIILFWFRIPINRTKTKEEKFGEHYIKSVRPKFEAANIIKSETEKNGVITSVYQGRIYNIKKQIPIPNITEYTAEIAFNLTNNDKVLPTFYFNKNDINILEVYMKGNNQLIPINFNDIIHGDTIEMTTIINTKETLETGLKLIRIVKL